MLCIPPKHDIKEETAVSRQKFTAFIKTIELGSITKAATYLGYTQSAVSRMIADLEEEWGLTLLTRSRAGVSISSDGLTLLPLLRGICAGYENLDRAVTELHGVQTGTIRVGTFTSVAASWLPQIIKAFHERYPNIEFQLMNSENYTEIEGWIRHGVVDCGFVSIPTVNDLEVTYLKQDMLVAVLPASHPLAEAPLYPIPQLYTETFIKLKEDSDYEITRFLDNLEKQPKLGYEVSDDHTILSMVECGLGMSIMHALIAKNPRYHVVWKPLDRPQYRDIGIAVRKSARPSGITDQFIAQVKTWVDGNA